MGSSKLKVIHVIIIGSLACVLMIVGFYFALIKKINENIADVRRQYDDAKVIADKRTSVEAELAQAKRDNDLLLVKYTKMMNEKMPVLSFQDRMGGWFELMHEQADVLGPKLTAWPAKSGIRMTSSFTIPPPPDDWNSLSDKMITIPLGNVTVTGTFAKILAHVRSWNHFDRLVQVDPVDLSGHSPYMTGTYALTLYIFPRGTVGPTVGMAGAANNKAAAATGPSAGMMRGMPGGPKSPGASPPGGG